MITPESVRKSPQIALKSVDFPAPLEPMIVAKSPFSSSSDRSLIACFSFTVPGFRYGPEIASTTITEDTSFSINAGILNLSATVYTRRKINEPSTIPTALTKIPPLPRIVPPISREASAIVTIPCPILMSTDFCD